MLMARRQPTPDAVEPGRGRRRLTHRIPQFDGASSCSVLAAALKSVGDTTAGTCFVVSRHNRQWMVTAKHIVDGALEAGVPEEERLLAEHELLQSQLPMRLPRLGRRVPKRHHLQQGPYRDRLPLSQMVRRHEPFLGPREG
jgi:hypothetical protein